MYYLRNASERGTVNFDWLISKHSFSFGDYYDPKHMGLSALRVINEDKVMPGAGFDKHGHRDMEIISYILAGSIEHKDSMGNQFVVAAGEIQRISAGTGITHSEFNHSSKEVLHFLQIWIQPNKKAIAPSYAQQTIIGQGALTPLVTADGRDGSLSMQQDASLYRLQLHAGEQWQFATVKRPGYLHVIEGKADLNGYTLKSGDALGASHEKLHVKAQTELTALWFDLPNLDNY